MNSPIQLALAAPRTYDFQSDASGNWDMKISNDLTAGPHVVTVEDDKGNLDQAIMYVIKDTKTATGTTSVTTQNQIVMVDRVTKTVPDSLHIPIGIMAALCLILSTVLTILARLADKEEKLLAKVDLSSQVPGQQISAKHKIHHFLQYAVVIATLSLVVVVGVGIWLNRETNFLSRFFHPVPASALINEISGQVIDPITRAGVAGADLVSGQTSIRTSGSGGFIFSLVNPADGIRMTHPGLLRSIVIMPESTPKQQRLDILFNEQMYMVLTRVLDAEARGQIADIYSKYLSPDIKNQITSEVFVQRYSNVMTAKNITDQQITIRSMKVVDNYVIKKYQSTLNKAIVLTLNLNGEDAVYVLQPAGDKWYIAK